MALTNFTAATAMVISTLPYYVTVSAADIQSAPGLTHDLWWKYTNADYAMINYFALGSLFGVLYPPGKTFNVPQISLWRGSPGSLTAISFLTDIQGSMQAPSLMLPDTIYIQVAVGSDGFNPTEPVSDSMTLRALPGPRVTGEVGTILVTDFNPDFPAMVVGPATVIGTEGTIRQMPNFASCDFGDVLDSGIIALLDNSTSPLRVKIYAADGSLVATVTGITNSDLFQQIRGDGQHTFYVGRSTNSTNAEIHTVSDTGVVGGTSWTLPNNSRALRGMAPNRANTILYYSAQFVSNTSEVHAYDLIGNAALPDLAAALGGYSPQKDMYVMQDGSILVGYRATSGDAKLIRYAPNGTVLKTYVMPTAYNLDRFALGVDDPDSFWVWLFLISDNGGTARFSHIRTSDGAELPDSFNTPVFTDGLFDLGNASVNDPPAFGVSNSCPLIVLRKPLLLQVPRIPTVDDCCCDVVPGGGTPPPDAPPGAPNPGPTLLPISPEWDVDCTADGIVPTQADPVDFEVWA